MNSTIRFVLVGLCVVCLATPAMTQSIISVGVFGGPHFGSMTTDPEISNDTRAGLAAGANIEFGLSPMFYISAGASYVQKGSKITAGSQSVTFAFDYIDIPVQVKLKFPIPASPFKPFIYGGGTVGILMKSELSSGDQSVDVKDDMESTMFSAEFGAGGEFSLNPVTSIFASVGYSVGLSDVAKGDGSIKLNGVPIVVGVRFGL